MARRGRPGGLRIGEWVRAGGTSGVVRLRMGGTTGARVGKYRYDLDWMCSSLDGETFPDEGFDRTTNTWYKTGVTTNATPFLKIKEIR